MARQAAKTAFKVGDKAVYPAHGVGVIESIETKTISGDRHKFYMLRILENDMTIMIPTQNVDTVGLRTVIDRRMVSKIYRILRDQDIKIDTQTWNRRYREYTEKIKTGSVLEIAQVLRDLFLLKRKKKELSFGERKMLDTARNLLVKEISIAKGMNEEDVVADLERVLGDGKSSGPTGKANGSSVASKAKVSVSSAKAEVAANTKAPPAKASTAKASPAKASPAKSSAKASKAVKSSKAAKPAKASKASTGKSARTKSVAKSASKTAKVSSPKAKPEPKPKPKAKTKAGGQKPASSPRSSRAKPGARR